MSDAPLAGATLELAIHPDDLRRLHRHPALLGGPARRSRGTVASIIWHDTEVGTLAQEGLALLETAKSWRLERLGGGLVAAAPTRAALNLEGEYRPVARFEGRDRRIEAGAVTLALRSGTIRVGEAGHPSHRLTLTGPPDAVASLAERLATDLRAEAPTETLTAAAIRLSGGPVPAPPLGAADVAPGSTVADAFIHLAAQLTATIRHWCARIGHDTSQEPVHQARVAIRRLRSVLSLFRAAVAGPEIDRIIAALRALAAKLGAARDWDVFLAETAAPVQAAFAGDRRLARLGSRATRHRAMAYAALAAYLESPEFRILGIALAGLGTVCLWRETADPTMLGEDITAFAARILSHRRRKLVKAGKTIAELPPETLHSLRKRGKKFRYGCEFFAPLFPKSPKRLLRRLARLQESLGHLNDGATAAALLAELGNGRARSYASGAVQGFTVAKGTHYRDHIQRSWTRFRREGGFWEK